jgi:hypothetical protein
MTTGKVPARIAHFLQTGCWAKGRPDLDLFLMFGKVLRGELSGLARLWEDCAPLLRRGRAEGEWFAEMALRVRDNQKWPAEYGRGSGRGKCVVEHPRTDQTKEA